MQAASWIPAVAVMALLAGTSISSAAEAPADSSGAQALDADSPRTGYPLFTWGIGYARPQIVAASFTLMRANTDLSGADGLFVQARPGIAGGEISLGYGLIVPTHRNGDLPPVLGFALRASLLRTWGSPQGYTTDRTYAGPQFDMVFIYFKYSVGWMWALDSKGGSDDSELTWSLGIGF